jgi:hypothetical protein
LAAAVRGCDAGRLLRLLRGQRLVALLGTRALAAAPGALPASFTAEVERAVDANRARGLALGALAVHAAGQLEAAGIPALPLKGPALARRLHGDEGLRATNDLDLLVARDQLGAASVVLASLGYVEEHEPAPELHLTLRDPRGQLTRVDLHWRVHWYEDEFSRDLLGRSTPGGDGARVPVPADDLAALLLFYARDGFFGLRVAADLAAWWDRHGAETDSPALAPHYDRYPALRRALVAAAGAAERVVGVPAARLLPVSAATDRRTRTAVALASWSGAGELDQLAANVTLVDLLLSPPRGLTPSLQRHVLLSAGRIESTYDLRPGPSVRRRAWRLLHPPKMALRYALGLAGAIAQRRQALR